MSKEELKEIFKEYNERELSDDERKQIRKVTKHALIRLGARTDFSGFDIVCVAVELSIENPNLLRHVCSQLYPTVAEVLGGLTADCVERNIRNLIECIFEEKSFCEFNRMFKAAIFSVDDKPTATEFIRLLVEYYLLGLWH